MLITLAFVIILFGFCGVMILALKHKDKNKKLSILDGEVSEKLKQLDNYESIGGIFSKSNKIISWASKIDKSGAVKCFLVVFFGAAIIILGQLLGIELSQKNMLMALFIDIVVVILLPGMVSKQMIDKRIRAINNDLPLMIDIMAVCIQSGMTIERSLFYIADNIQSLNVDMGVMLHRTVTMAEVSGITGALEDMAIKIPSQEMRMLCTTLQQSIKFGSSVYQVLIDLSGEIRAMQLLATEEKVASLSSKMTIPMIGLIMLPLLLIVAGPGIIGMMSTWSK